jgi:AraC-like DNA-binding protein
VLNSGLPRSGASARDLIMLGIERGIDPSVLLRGTGLSRAGLQDISAEITAEHELRLIENLVRQSDDPTIGLRAGARSTIATFGMLGFACASVPTLRESIEISLRYQDLAFTLARANLVGGDDATYIVIDTSHLPESIRAFVVDHLIATIWVAFREMGATLDPPRVELARPAARDIAVYEEFCGAIPRFAAAADRLGFANHDLDRRRTAVDATALRLLERGISVQEVAGTLGYASSSSFVHAFKRWTPTTPGRHKAAARAGFS